ncbi:uncharacterized protein isoform X1 [Leptinotarsa decemlineata]|uniref:uncharacterized protein isoform X1 n=2 Tax=Leptinotarsa decemlineata TaxID=7539 RepID=UPI003D30C9D9
MYSICYCSCVLLAFLQLFTGVCYSQLSVPEILFQAQYANSTKFKRELNEFQCKLPSYPENGQWSVINGYGKPGDDVEINTMIKFECLPGYMLTPDTPYVVCDRNWSPDIIPKCRRLCRPFYSTPTTNLKCKDRNGYAIGCDKATDGTYLTYECIPHYEVPLGRKQSLLCYDGIWDFPKPVCQPVCGKKPANDTLTLSWGASDAKESEYPWVVAIYQKNGINYTNVCGGTLISRRVVITAAHCVSNDYGQTSPVENYEVAAGKYYNKHGDCRDKEAQYMKIAHILIHKQFRGEHRRFQYDIAVIVTKKLFILGPKVQPVCINDINYIYPHIGDIGEVAGWGVTENGEPSDTLKSLKIPLKKSSTCSAELPVDWERRYNLEDKICTGFFRQNMSVCKGDSGSGLIFKNPEDNRFYLHGVVSLSPKAADGQCNHEQNALFTKVANYYEWIDRESTTNYIEECSLPAHPKNGKWVMENGAVRKPGEIVPSTAVLIFSCNDGYKLSAVSPKFFCEPSFQPPTCNLLCPSLIFPKNSTVICKDYKNENIDCTDTTEGSSVSFTCPSGYATSQGTSGVRFCVNGSWGKPKPVCKRKFSVASQTNTTAATTPLLNQTVEDTTGVKVICTYNSDYSHKGVYPENLDASMCTHLVYEFIGLWDKGDVRVQDDLIDLDQEHRGLYLRSTDLKRKNPNLKVLLSVGGTAASNSTLFSRIAGHAGKTGAFLGSSGYFIKTYHFDGLNIDWQFPKEEDKEKYMSFLETVRYEFDKTGWLLSASVRSDPAGTGYDPPKMNKLLDWITIKSYDFYEASSSNYTGIHNPLYHSPKETKWEKRHLNMEAAANNWLNAGISREKLVLSVAFHGRSFQLKDADKHEIHSPITGPGPGGDTGFLDYAEICSTYGNYTGVWDDDQKTPYKYHEDKWFGFNSKDSVWIKGDYVRKKGFFGVNVWPVDADDVHGKCGTKQILLKHVHGGIGNKVNWD